MASRLAKVEASQVTILKRLDALMDVLGRPTGIESFYTDRTDLTPDSSDPAEVLNQIADGSFLPDEQWATRAVEGLRSEDAATRSSAARALAVMAPELARAELPSAIDVERNKAAASIMRGALRAASIK